MNMDITASVALDNASYTDLNGLNEINQLGKKDQALALKELSKQFESLFLNLMLKSMRDSNAVFEEGGMFQSNEMQFHRDMFDNQLALTMSEGKGIGLADAFYEQMMLQYPQPGEARDTTPYVERPLPDRGIPVSPYKVRQPEVIDGVPGEKANNNYQASMQIPGRENITPANELIATNRDQVIRFDGTPKNFVENIYPHALKAAEKLAVDPETLIAQAALETGWGKYVLDSADGESSNNVFNIKTNQDWQGSSVSVSALEYKDGLAVKENSRFKKYESIQDSFDDYAKLISQNPRYQEAASESDPKNYLRGLQSAGYATDPDYAEKIMTLYEADVIQSARQSALSKGVLPQG